MKRAGETLAVAITTITVPVSGGNTSFKYELTGYKG
jgi:hypothetical protein